MAIQSMMAITVLMVYGACVVHLIPGLPKRSPMHCAHCYMLNDSNEPPIATTPLLFQRKVSTSPSYERCWSKKDPDRPARPGYSHERSGSCRLREVDPQYVRARGYREVRHVDLALRNDCGIRGVSHSLDHVLSLSAVRIDLDDFACKRRGIFRVDIQETGQAMMADGYTGHHRGSASELRRKISRQRQFRREEPIAAPDRCRSHQSGQHAQVCRKQ
jgi:hypothetical protein